MLTVDTREPAYMKAAFPGAKLEKLEYGDFRYVSEGRTVLIERKTVDDLRASIFDGRLARQLAGMQEVVAANGYACLLLDGVIRTTTENRNLLVSALVDAQLSGIIVICRYSDIPTVIADTIRMLSARREPMTARASVAMEKGQLSLLGTIPGIGRSGAKKLMLAHGTLRKALASVMGDEKMGGFFDGK